jgi:CRISPR-associated endoribonuclease Cas6
LHSSVYYLENIKITGYMGRLTLVISGPEQLARLTGALLCFAEYCGLGVKTALGMGAVRVKQIN